jgi:uncharacterized membrane protein
MKAYNRNSILPIHIILIVVGVLDLLTTVYWLQIGRIIEFNPIMAAVLKAGMPCFILVKLSTLAAYVGVMEWYRRRNECFARKVGNLTVAAYLGIYTVSFFIVNYRTLMA